MKTQKKNKLELIKNIKKILDKENVTYDESKYIFRRVREMLELKPIVQPKKLPRFISEQEVNEMIKIAYQTNPVYALILKTFFVTAIRVSELVNLKVEDLFLDEKKVKIIQGKGKKDRMVLINNELANDFRLYLNDRDKGHLFLSNRDKKFTARRVEQIIRGIGEKAGINKDVTPHTIRHTAATYWLNKGLRLDQVQLLLGHSNPKTTEIYAKTSLEAVQEDYDRIMEK